MLREASTVACISHPGIVKIFDAGDVNGSPYIIMEYVDGGPLDTLLKNGPLPEARIIELMTSVANALHAVHCHGLIHRDLKPQNILIDKNGQPKIIDFGFTTTKHVEQERAQHGGSLLYSSPEQTGMIKLHIDHRSDLYSLGVLMYECATGVPPFRATDLGQLVHQHATVAPTDPKTLKPDLTAELSQIILKLLAKDPDDRYQTAAALARDLENIGKDASKQKVFSNRSYDDEDSLELALLGRENELAEITTQYEKALRGSGSIVLVEGKPGSGKSRLVREALRKAHRADCLILTTKCLLNDPSPLSPLRRALDDFIRKNRNDENALKPIRETIAATKDYTQFLLHFSHELASLIGEEKSSQIHEDSEEQYFTAISTFFIKLGQDHAGAILFIDDVQWLDDSSSRLLKYLSFKVRESSLLIICSARSESEYQDKVLQFAANCSHGLSERITVDLFDELAVSRLVSLHLGGRQISQEFIKRIASLSEGNPFAVGQYLASVLEDGLIWPNWEKWQVDFEGMERIHLPKNIFELVVKRIDQLGTDTKKILTVAALLDSHFKGDLLREICGASEEDVSKALVSASQMQLISKADNASYRFTHDRVRESLLSGLDQETKCRLHQKIADTLFSILGTQSESIYSIARHYLAGTRENPVRVYETCSQAGRKALLEYANRSAYEFLKAAKDFGKEPSLKVDVELLESFADAAARIFSLEEALSSYQDALGITQDKYARARIFAKRSSVLQAYGKVFPAWDEVRLAFGALGVKLPKSNLGWLVEVLKYTLASYFLTKTGFALGSAQGQSRKRHEALGELSHKAGWVVFFLDNPLILSYIIARPVYHSHLLGDKALLGMAYVFAGSVLAVFGIKKSAASLADNGFKLAEESKNKRAIAMCHVLRGFTIHASGYTAESEEYQKRYSLAEHKEWLDLVNFLNACTELVFGMIMRGHYNRALEIVEMAEERINRGSMQGNLVQGHLLFSQKIAILGGLQRFSEAREQMKFYESMIREYTNEHFRWNFYLQNQIFAYTAEGELGDPLEEAIKREEAFNILPEMMSPYARGFHVARVHARIAQYRTCSENARPNQLKLLRKAVSEMCRGQLHPDIKSHSFYARALIARIEGKPLKALKLLDEGENVAQIINSPWVQYEVYCERARIYKDLNRPIVAKGFAQLAASLADQENWISRLEQLRKEFGIDVDSSRRSRSRSSSETHVGSSSEIVGSYKSRRDRDALLEMSLASSGALSPEIQAINALDEIVRILASERAFLFLKDNDTGELKAEAGRNQQKQSLTELKGFSSTLVKKVAAEQRAYVVNGTEEGALLGSQSAVLNKLRSMMAAPMIVRGQLLGVVYADSSLTKGLFTPDDAKILTALANHIGLALETARTAKLELERRVLEKELETKKAVQNILDNLPEGFMTFNREGVIQPGVSRASFEIFKGDPQHKAFTDIVNTPADKLETYRTWMQMLFDEPVSFESLTPLGPKALETDENKYIEFEYKPIRDQHEKVERVICIAKDKTTERALAEKAHTEAAYSRMVVNVLKNRDSFVKTILEIRSSFEHVLGLLTQSPFPEAEIKRALHSIKGAASIYSIADLQKAAHTSEDALAAGKLVPDALRANVTQMKTILESFLSRNRHVFGQIDEKSERELHLPVSKVESTVKLIARQCPPPVVATAYETLVKEPLASLFEPYASLVYEVSQQQSKEVDFVINTSDLTVWYEPYQSLFGTIVHAIRNAVDHGIETPFERQQNGKRSRAILEISATKTANGMIQFQITDDGRGVDIESVRQNAIARGIASKEALAQMPAQDVLQLVFLEGFSTKKNTTLLSGRGIGMDAIQKEAVRLGGKAWIQSTPLKGTAVHIEVPIIEMSLDS